jgi:hypothetical protein
VPLNEYFINCKKDAREEREEGEREEGERGTCTNNFK